MTALRLWLSVCLALMAAACALYVVILVFVARGWRDETRKDRKTRGRR